MNSYSRGDQRAGPYIPNRSSASTQEPLSLQIEIGELVLHGFPPQDQYELNRVLQQELTRLISEKGIPPSWSRGGDVPFLDGGDFNVTPGSAVQAFAAQVARAVYGGLNQ